MEKYKEDAERTGKEGWKMTGKAVLPTGIENFEEMRTRGYYYADKTGLIRDLIKNMGKVNLFTRPRRFGKTLNVSMLKYFYETGCNRELFQGLEIYREKELCESYMGKFPVISISLKGVSGRTFDEAKGMMRSMIGEEALRFEFLAKSSRLSETERMQYRALIQVGKTGSFVMDDELLKCSLRVLSRFLHKHYGQPAMILIDEYDVPLDKAYHLGYYEDMAELIRALFGQALKSNDSLYFAVLTGCLRISKESIFTGLNNFKVYTVQDVRFHEYFGFTDTDVRKMLAYYGLEQHYDEIREWYDGYQFGNQGIYCPWDVINYCGDLLDANAVKPQNYWINTSSNDIVRKFVDKANAVARNEIEVLMEGGSIKKEIYQELTYRNLDSGIDFLWSILFTTGYLTQRRRDGDLTELVIPNREIHTIFARQIREWFAEETGKDSRKLAGFCRAFEENDTASIEEGFTSYLKKVISIRDTNVKKELKENFYQGILLGIFGHMDDWDVRSNAEAGDGYSDIMIEAADKDIGIVIELKYAENGRFDAACSEALKQIREKKYAQCLIDDGMKTIYKYGIACYKKRCRVISE